MKEQDTTTFTHHTGVTKCHGSRNKHQGRMCKAKRTPREGEKGGGQREGKVFPVNKGRTQIKKIKKGGGGRKAGKSES